MGGVHRCRNYSAKKNIFLTASLTSTVLKCKKGYVIKSGHMNRLQKCFSSVWQNWLISRFRKPFPPRTVADINFGNGYFDRNRRLQPRLGDVNNPTATRNPFLCWLENISYRQCFRINFLAKMKIRWKIWEWFCCGGFCWSQLDHHEFDWLTLIGQYKYIS